MQRTKIMRYVAPMGVALLAAAAIAGADAGSVSATGHEFDASKTTKVTIKSTNGNQVFSTGAGTIECTSASGTSEVTAGKTEKEKETISYSGCSGFNANITISPVHFEFNANGPAKIEKNVTVTPEGAGCHVTIPVQMVESVDYSNASGNVDASAAISKIHSYGNGGGCGTEEETNGTYSGDTVATPESGTLKWE